MADKRPRPEITGLTAAFWHGGAAGELRVQRCGNCRWWLHPPLPMCPRCRGRELEPEAVAGTGTVYSFTVNRYQWTPSLVPPYIIAEVELDEQPGLRLLTSIVGCADVTIGMPVRVRFEPAGGLPGTGLPGTGLPDTGLPGTELPDTGAADTWVPVFAP
jgi:uncharacterized OB-fold protein